MIVHTIKIQNLIVGQEYDLNKFHGPINVDIKYKAGAEKAIKQQIKQIKQEKKTARQMKKINERNKK